MLIAKNVPPAEVDKLKPGDFFIDGHIEQITRGRNMKCLKTTGGSVFHIHRKQTGYNVFRMTKLSREIPREGTGESGK
jgi:hypothetical protein